MQTKDSARAVCPWYEWSTEKLIVCSGTEPGQTIRMQFRGRKKKEQWFERCCAGYDYGAQRRDIAARGDLRGLPAYASGEKLPPPGGYNGQEGAVSAWRRSS